MTTKIENTETASPEVRFSRWRDFALRMARTCYAKSKRPGPDWIVRVVEDWFLQYDPDDIECIVNWDHSDPYPPGNPLAGREHDTSYCGCGGWRHEHRKPNPECPECNGSGLRHRPFEPMCVADMMEDFLYGYYGWRGSAPQCPACLDYDSDEDCTCDDVEDRFAAQWDEQWGGPVQCCIRAGLDCAFEESAGVIGFTAGDLRRMYPDGVPAWAVGSDPWNIYTITEIVPGVGFVPSEPEPNGTFQSLPDNAAIWL